MKKVAIRSIAVVFALSVGSFTVTACNTIEGAGKDVQAVGKGVSKGASKTKSKL
jgi:predicted small secreted protein